MIYERKYLVSYTGLRKYGFSTQKTCPIARNEFQSSCQYIESSKKLDDVLHVNVILELCTKSRPNYYARFNAHSASDQRVSTRALE